MHQDAQPDGIDTRFVDFTRRQVVKGGITGLGALSLGGLIAACGGGGSGGGVQKTSEAKQNVPVKRGGTLVVAVDAVTGSVEPQIFAGFGPWMALDSIGRGLTHIDFVSNDPKPSMAESWDVSADKLTYRFTMRKGLVFQDDERTPVTARDAERTFRRMMNPDDPSSVKGSYSVSELGGANIRSAKAIDDATFEVKLAQPDQVFIKRLSHPAGRIISAKAIDRYGRKIGSNIVCAGPFKLAQSVPGEKLVLEAFDKYFEGRPPVDRVIFQQLSDPSSLTAAALAGRVQNTVFIPLSNGKQIDRSPRVKVFEAEPGTDIFVNMNAGSGVLRDLKVRQAINYAIDRRAIIKQAFFGRAKPPAGLVPPTELGYSDELKKYSTQDMARAKQLLAEAGAQGKEVNCLHQNNDFYPTLGQIIEQNLQELGLKPRTQYVDAGTFNARWFDPERHELVTSQRSSFIPDPDDKFSAQLAGDSVFAQSASQSVKLPTQKELDRLMIAAREETDPDKRAERYKELDVFLFDKVMVFAMLAYNARLVVGSSNLANIFPTAQGTERIFLERAGFEKSS